MKVTVIYKGQANEVDISKELVEEWDLVPPSKVWEPKTNDIYYFLDNRGMVSEGRWEDDYIDKDRYNRLNCYKTKDEAVFASACHWYEAKYKHWLIDNNEPIDWANGKQKKWYAVYKYYPMGACIDFNVARDHKIQGVLYATSKQIILDFIAEIGEDNFKKYILKV